MAKGTNIILRCTEDFKVQVKALASKENRTVSNYIINLVTNEIRKEREKP